jgi:hypothetical protein
VRNKLRSAFRLIKSLEERQRTIYKVAVSIVKHQRDFLDHGIERMRPLVLKDVADDIGMHESTVSRVVNNKYMHTHRGLFELRFFFHSGIASAHGGDNVSSLTVKERIRKIVSAEDGSARCRTPRSSKCCWAKDCRLRDARSRSIEKSSRFRRPEAASRDVLGDAMQVHITGRQVAITPALRKFTEEKLRKVEKLLAGPIEAHVVLAVEKRRHHAEIQVKSRTALLSGSGRPKTSTRRSVMSWTSSSGRRSSTRKS